MAKLKVTSLTEAKASTVDQLVKEWKKAYDEFIRQTKEAAEMPLSFMKVTPELMEAASRIPMSSGEINMKEAEAWAVKTRDTLGPIPHVPLETIEKADAWTQKIYGMSRYAITKENYPVRQAASEAALHALGKKERALFDLGYEAPQHSLRATFGVPLGWDCIPSAFKALPQWGSILPVDHLLGTALVVRKHVVLEDGSASVDDVLQLGKVLGWLVREGYAVARKPGSPTLHTPPPRFPLREPFLEANWSRPWFDSDFSGDEWGEALKARETQYRNDNRLVSNQRTGALYADFYSLKTVTELNKLLGFSAVCGDNVAVNPPWPKDAASHLL